MKRILIAEDDSAFSKVLVRFLENNKMNAEAVDSGISCMRQLMKQAYDLLILDFRLPDMNGLEVLEQVRNRNLRLPVLIITSYSHLQTAIRTMKMGATDYITKPVNPDELLVTIKQVFRNQEKNDAPSEASGFIEGSSATSRQIMEHIKLVAPTSFSVIIFGESGTGKEFAARRIHELSKRSKQPFIALDCGALSDEIAGSELFGHVKGAFTGALHTKSGVFQAANRGTLFLDEIGNLSYDIQIKLLRAIQEGKVRKMGSTEEEKTDVRIIVATNEDISGRESHFREDLYYRLNEFQLTMLSLRNREEDIPEFLHHFLELANRELGKEVAGFTPEALHLLQRYTWPGNIRELKNIVRRSVLLCNASKVHLDHLPQEIQRHSPQPTETDITDSSDLKAIQHQTERQLIEETLKKVRYNKSEAARLLNIDRKTLYNKIKQYGMGG